MPELPEVEVLVRNLDRTLSGKNIRCVRVRRRRVLGRTTPSQLLSALGGATFQSVARRGKYLIFTVNRKDEREGTVLLGHLGMTGRMYLAASNSPIPKHAAVVMDLGQERFVFEDTRYFGRLTLDASPLERLGPEPLEKPFTVGALVEGLKRSGQPIKVKLLDQRLVAGIGNIYASEALFLARVSPLTPANKLTRSQIVRLHRSIRKVLLEAIRFGSTVPLTFAAEDSGNGLFYYGRSSGSGKSYEDKLRVYDRCGLECVICNNPIQRIFQAGRSTFYCKACQIR